MDKNNKDGYNTKNMGWALAQALNRGELEIEQIEGVTSCQKCVRRKPTDKYPKFIVKIDKTTRDVEETKKEVRESGGNMVVQKDDENDEKILFSFYLIDIDNHLHYDEVKIVDEPDESLDDY